MRRPISAPLAVTTRKIVAPLENCPLQRDNFSFRPSGVTLERTVEGPVRFIQVLQGRDTYENISADLARGGRPISSRAGVSSLC
jgi:hypothetical protein